MPIATLSRVNSVVRSYVTPLTSHLDVITPFKYHDTISIPMLTGQILATVILSILNGILLTRYGTRLSILYPPLPPTLFLLPLLPLPFLLTSFTDNHHALDLIITSISFLSLRIGSSLQPVGITGSISTGKSTVSKTLSTKHNQKIIDIDVIAHSILHPSHPITAYNDIVISFGTGVLDEGEGRIINRTKLGKVIFKDDNMRRILNRITHPRIRRCMFGSMISARILGFRRMVFVDVPLLFESKGLRYLFGAIVVVSTTKELQFSRLVKRNPELTEEQCRDRINSQMSLDYKVSRATIVINNDGSEEDLMVGIRRMYEVLKRNNAFEICAGYLVAVVGVALVGNDDGEMAFLGKMAVAGYMVWRNMFSE